MGEFDTTETELASIRNALDAVVMNDYDRLIQLCDALAGSTCILDIEERMADVRRRYGFYPQAKWDRNLELQRYFERKTGTDLAVLLEKDCFSL